MAFDREKLLKVKQESDANKNYVSAFEHFQQALDGEFEDKLQEMCEYSLKQYNDEFLLTYFVTFEQPLKHIRVKIISDIKGTLVDCSFEYARDPDKLREYLLKEYAELCDKLKSLGFKLERINNRAIEEVNFPMDQKCEAELYFRIDEEKDS